MDEMIYREKKRLETARNQICTLSRDAAGNQVWSQYSSPDNLRPAESFPPLGRKNRADVKQSFTASQRILPSSLGTISISAPSAMLLSRTSKLDTNNCSFV